MYIVYIFQVYCYNHLFISYLFVNRTDYIAGSTNQFKRAIIINALVGDENTKVTAVWLQEWLTASNAELKQTITDWIESNKTDLETLSMFILPYIPCIFQVYCVYILRLFRFLTTSVTSPARFGRTSSEERSDSSTSRNHEFKVDVQRDCQ